MIMVFQIPVGVCVCLKKAMGKGRLEKSFFLDTSKSISKCVEGSMGTRTTAKSELQKAWLVSY